MTDNNHPITPSRELIQQWLDETDGVLSGGFVPRVATWGWQQRDASVADELQKARDEELEACCEWITEQPELWEWASSELRAARRPKPKSLAEKALEAMQRMWEGSPDVGDWDLIRRALERLQELEGQDNDSIPHRLNKESDY